MLRALTAFTLAASFTLGPAAHGGKKVFISADMEGISGISGADQLSAAGAEYGRSRKMMADDVNAAIRGARAGGATTVVVNDSHGSMRNLRLEDLEQGVHLISHSFKQSGMMEGLDESFDAVIFVGYHAKAGHPGGLFAHTGSGVVRDVRVNGQSLGEGGLNATVAAWYGVPVALVTGDDVAVKQVAEVATSAKIVAVKRAINPRAVELRPFRRSRRDRTRGGRRRTCGEEVPAETRGELQGRGPVQRGRDPRGGRKPAGHAASGPRHHLVHSRDDAEGLHADSIAVSLHQSGLKKPDYSLLYDREVHRDAAGEYQVGAVRVLLRDRASDRAEHRKVVAHAERGAPAHIRMCPREAKRPAQRIRPIE